MKTKYKVLISLTIIIVVLGLTGFLVWWFKFRKKSEEYLHKRLSQYNDFMQRDFHKGVTTIITTAPATFYTFPSFISRDRKDSVPDTFIQHFSSYHWI